MATRVQDFDAGRLIAQQHAFGLPEVTNDWEGWTVEFPDYMKTVSAAKNGIFKPIYHWTGWMKAMGYELSPVQASAERAAKDAKNGLGLTEVLPKAMKFTASVEKFVDEPSAWNAYKSVSDGLGIISPVCDSWEFLHSRISVFTPDTMKGVGNANAIALGICMIDETRKDVHTIAQAVETLNSDELDGAANEAEVAQALWRQIGLNLIDLVKTVSYVALAAIALLAAFVMAIPNAGFLILCCSTSALVSTLLGEFAGRAYNPQFPEKITIPVIELVPNNNSGGGG
jgi:hypothetical protein